MKAALFRDWVRRKWREIQAFPLVGERSDLPPEHPSPDGRRNMTVPLNLLYVVLDIAFNTKHSGSGRGVQALFTPQGGRSKQAEKQRDNVEMPNDQTRLHRVSTKLSTALI